MNRLLTILILFLFLTSCAALPGSDNQISDDPVSEVKIEPASTDGNGVDTNKLVEESSEPLPVPEPADGGKPEMETGLVSDSSQEEESVEPEPSVPAPFSGRELRRRAIALVPEILIHLNENNSPLGISHDLDKNGYEDFIMPVVEASQIDPLIERGAAGGIDAEILKDPVRLFYERKEYISYSLLIFYQYPGKVVLRYSIPISRQLVFTGFRTQEIKVGRDFPFAVSTSFKTQGGTRQEWVILNGQGISRFAIQETLSVIPVVDDIDGDGIIDVVVHEQAAEEGIGYETFLTWYKWNGEEFIESRSTNIVRNLRTFFSGMAETLLSGDRRAFLDYVLLPDTEDEYTRKGASQSEIFEELFLPAEGGGEPFSDLHIHDVVYPVLMETPFTYEKRGRFEFPFTMGIITDNGGSYYRARLVMNRNPFSDDQFGFVPVE
ncbi:MAG: hypothetical protein JEY99_12240 [Spirochaetales bacterium]|nr:hypothetical protein [Spirochaetales bacterium]